MKCTLRVNGKSPAIDDLEITPLTNKTSPNTNGQISAIRDQSRHAPQHLIDIPDDAAMDDATLTCWNGQRFVSWETYIMEQLRRPVKPPGDI